MADKKGWKRHFTGKGEQNIHTARTPRCKRGAACEYQNLARKGPVARYKKPQDHHVVPVSAMIRYQDPKEDYEGYTEIIDDAYRDQDYCANNKQNLWWLPTKATYLNQSRRSMVWDLNLPCHTIGHAAYFKEVLVELRSKIWDPLKKRTDQGKKCPDPLDVVTIVFTNLEKDFRKYLTERGMRPGGMGGTRWAIDHQGQVSDWWHAFSMASSPDETEAVSTFITEEIPAALRRR
jgi:hypothetical protein